MVYFSFILFNIFANENILLHVNGVFISENTGGNPEYFIDGDEEFAWGISNTILPYSFVYELPITAEISSINFFNSPFSDVGAEATTKEIKIEGAMENTSYIKIGNFIIEKGAKEEEFELEPFKTKYLRFTIISNHGHPTKTTLKEIEVKGRFLQKVLDIDISGEWSNFRGKTFSVYQKGPIVWGCYGTSTTGFEGAFDGENLNFRWREKEISGIATGRVNAAGNKLAGIYLPDEFTKFILPGRGLYWKAIKVSSTPVLKCEGNTFEDEFKQTGKVITYSIIFETNSYVVKKSSFMIIKKIASLLKENSNLKINLEGHTDSTGTKEYNKTLSLKRAESVKKILVEMLNIKDDRIQCIGYGDEKPIADNSTEGGRRLNRRVGISVRK